jgi:hypothetical protein
MNPGKRIPGLSNLGNQEEIFWKKRITGHQIPEMCKHPKIFALKNANLVLHDVWNSKPDFKYFASQSVISLQNTSYVIHIT